MTDKQIPAFPLHNHGTQTLGMHFTGMTLRDYFAAKAMQAILGASISSDQYEDDAEQAYVIADAMIKERNGQN
jgi:hypothetical protein